MEEKKLLLVGIFFAYIVLTGVISVMICDDIWVIFHMFGFLKIWDWFLVAPIRKFVYNY